MGLLDKIQKPLDDYISICGFIKDFSQNNKFNLYDVITYFNHYDLIDKLIVYFIDTDYKIMCFDNADYHALQLILNQIQTAFIFDNFVWSNENFDKLEPQRKEVLAKLANPKNSIHWFFKKQDLVDFEPLKDYVSFLNIEPTPKQIPLFYKQDFFTTDECASMIAGEDPQTTGICHTQKGYEALNLVLASVHTDLFEPHPFINNGYLISANNFRKWLKSKEIFIDGFSNQENLATPINQQLDTSDLQTQINQLQQRIAELETQNQLKDERIAELESQTTENRMMLKGLDLVNHDKAKAQLFAKVIAKSVWQMDTTKQIKSGDMVQYIKSLLLQFDDKNRPQTDETISDWLKEIKPDYAKQGGRAPNDAPTEIPLVFQNTRLSPYP